MKQQKSTLLTPQTAQHSWVLVDVKDKAVGRAASAIANVLRGKHRPTYTPHVDGGDFVVVVNADSLRFTGNKLKKKEYHRHTGYFGGLKSITAEKQLAAHPDRVLRDAVWGMLPKNRLSRQLIKKLKIYSGTEHPHEAQKPETINIESVI
jgi:large subunit ribosomal protein L13